MWKYSSPGPVTAFHRRRASVFLHASYPSRLHSRCPAMTESPATKPARGDGGQRARNGLRPERNGLLKSFRCKHELQPTHNCQPEEEEVRPGMGRERLGEHLLRGPGRCFPATALFPDDRRCHLLVYTPNIMRNIPEFEKKKNLIFSFVSCVILETTSFLEK